MSKRHARRIAANRNPSKPRWRTEGRALQRQIATLTDELSQTQGALAEATAQLKNVSDERDTLLSALPVASESDFTPPASPTEKDAATPTPSAG